MTNRSKSTSETAKSAPAASGGGVASVASGVAAELRVRREKSAPSAVAAAAARDEQAHALFAHSIAAVVAADQEDHSRWSDNYPKASASAIAAVEQAEAEAAKHRERAEGAAAQAREAIEHASQAQVDASKRMTATAAAMHEAEAAALQALAEASRTGDTPEARASVAEARERVKATREDAEWAILQHEGTRVALSAAQDDGVAAHRHVVAAEYVQAYAAYNNPDNRENVLIKQLHDTMAELVPLVLTRKALHARLDQEIRAMPADQRPPVPAGKPIVTDRMGLGYWNHTNFFTPDVGNAFAAGVAAGMAAAESS